MTDPEPPVSSASTPTRPALRRIHYWILALISLVAAAVLAVAGWLLDLPSALRERVPVGMRLGFWETRLFSLENMIIMGWHANPTRTAAAFTALMSSSAKSQPDRITTYAVMPRGAREIGDSPKFGGAWINAEATRIAWQERSEKGVDGFELKVDGEVVSDNSSNYLGPRYNSLSFQFSPAGKRWMFIGARTRIVGRLDADGIMRTRQEKSQCVVVDGKEDPWYRETINAQFSRDGTEYAYLAQRDDGVLLVVNGHELSPPKLGGGLLRNAIRNGKAVWAYVSAEHKGECVLFEGHSGDSFDDIRSLLISDDGRHLIYAAKRSGRWYVVRDNSVMSLPEGAIAVSDISISTDGSRFAYAFLRETGQTSLVIDGVETSAHQLVPFCEFSPDNRRFACIVIDDLPDTKVREVSKRYEEKSSDPLKDVTGIWRIIVDGKPGEPFTRASAPRFSPNAHHLAFTAQQGDSWYLIVDGKRSSAFTSIPDTVYAGPECFRALAIAKKALRQIEWYYPR